MHLHNNITYVHLQNVTHRRGTATQPSFVTTYVSWELFYIMWTIFYFYDDFTLGPWICVALTVDTSGLHKSSDFGSGLV